MKLLEPEERLGLRAEIEAAWRQSADAPLKQLGALKHLDAKSRAALLGEVRAVWWVAAERHLDAAVDFLKALSLEERYGLPSAAATQAFGSGEPLPEGTAPAVEDEVRELWRRMEPKQALAWLLRVRAGLRDLVGVEEIPERWAALMQQEPKEAIHWLGKAPGKLQPVLDDALMARLLASENAEVRLWAIARAGSRRASGKAKSAPPAAGKADQAGPARKR
jgi:hypothetical protein